jgi:hypothetical protein
MSKFTVDCFTEKSLPEPGFPENTYEAATVLEAAAVVHNCTRKQAGIRMVQIWIEEPDDREAVDTLKTCRCGTKGCDTKRIDPDEVAKALGAEKAVKPKNLPRRPGTR